MVMKKVATDEPLGGGKRRNLFDSVTLSSPLMLSWGLLLVVKIKILIIIYII